MPLWSAASAWQPFGFDAAGLLTLIGVEEVNRAVGRLVHSKYLEFMPLLAPFVITGNRFTEMIPGNILYNITGGIRGEVGAGWFARYLASHDDNISNARTVLRVTCPQTPYSVRFRNICALSISIVYFGSLYVFTALAYDMWGLASTSGILFSIVVRYVLVQANRTAIDASVLEYQKTFGTYSKNIKAAITTPGSKMVTVLMPSSMMFTLTRNPQVNLPRSYKSLRYAGWLAFVIHIVAINEASFVMRVLTALSLVVSTVLYAGKFGCTDSTWPLQRLRDRILGKPEGTRPPITTYVGSHLKIELFEWPPELDFQPEYSSTGQPEWKFMSSEVIHPSKRSQKRQDLYAWLQLTDEEEASLGKWDLLPHLRPGTEQWWHQYQSKKALVCANPVARDFIAGSGERSSPATTQEAASITSAAVASGTSSRVQSSRSSAIQAPYVSAIRPSRASEDSDLFRSEKDGARSSMDDDDDNFVVKRPVRTTTVALEEGNNSS